MSVQNRTIPVRVTRALLPEFNLSTSYPAPSAMAVGVAGSDRPIVVSGRSVIEVALVDRPDCHGLVACDGRPLGELMPGDKLIVRPSPDKITLLHPTGYDYFRLLRSKLNWGRRNFDPAR